MSVTKETKRVTTEVIKKMKVNNEKITMLTAYDFTMSTLIDNAGVEMILVGDSAANVMAGYETTLPITLDQMIYHAQCVVRGAKRSLVVVDLPFGSYQSNPQRALDSAIQIMKETEAHAIKLEGGEEIQDAVKNIVRAGIPVVGHLGLTPQSINQFGSYKVRAKETKEADRLIKDALLLEKIGCFAIVIEKIPSELAERVTSSLSIPTIGIGAGNKCDGQVLVIHDLLGLNNDFKPKFVRKYLDLENQINKAVGQYISDVKSTDFPNTHEQY